MGWGEFSMVKIGTLFMISLLATSCSFFGIQNEEGPSFKVIEKNGNFEIREYSSYIIAKTTVEGSYDDSSGEAFRILAGYIFGKNKGNKKIAMTSPVEMEEKPTKIAMTSPVEMSQVGDSFTMSFSMPSKYKIDDLPEPLDERISFEKIEPRTVASHEFSWFSSKKRNLKKAEELRNWLKGNKNYIVDDTHTFAGYNPPWTLPFLKRNEVHLKLEKK